MSGSIWITIETRLYDTFEVDADGVDCGPCHSVAVDGQGAFCSFFAEMLEGDPPRRCEDCKEREVKS